MPVSGASNPYIRISVNDCKFIKISRNLAIRAFNNYLYFLHKTNLSTRLKKTRTRKCGTNISNEGYNAVTDAVHRNVTTLNSDKIYFPYNWEELFSDYL